MSLLSWPRKNTALSQIIPVSIRTSRDSHLIDGHHKGDIFYNNRIKSKKLAQMWAAMCWLYILEEEMLFVCDAGVET
jgi:hypothetical protein